MNLSVIFCLISAGLFACMGCIFLFLKEKGAKYISGFNGMSEDERKQYDQKQMSIDQRNACFLWSLIYLAGAIASYLLHPYMVVIAFLVWLFSFCRDVHLDDEHAFSKYRIKHKE